MKVFLFLPMVFFFSSGNIQAQGYNHQHDSINFAIGQVRFMIKLTSLAKII